MQCHVLFFYKLPKVQNSLIKFLEKNKNSQIITNSKEVIESISKKGFSTQLFDELSSAQGKIGQENWNESKNYMSKYRDVLQQLEYENVDFLKGFEYSYLQQLLFIVKAKKFLQLEKDVIFLFDGYYSIYQGISKLAFEMGYESKFGFLRESGIQYQGSSSDKEFNEISKFWNLRTKKYIYEKYFQKMSISNFLLAIKLLNQVLSLKIHDFRKKYRKSDSNELEKILGMIDNKFSKMEEKYSSKCIFFTTTTRSDLYIKPWAPVLQMFEKMNIPYSLVTGDVVTGLVFETEKRKFVSVFKEIKILTEEIKSNEWGISTLKFLKENANEFYHPILDLFHQICRSIAMSVITNHILSKMTLIKSVVAVADYEMLEIMAIESCKKYQISTFAINYMTFEPEPAFADWFHADKIFISGKFHQETLSKLGYDSKRFIMTGNPNYDYLKKIDKTECRRKVSNKYKFDSQRKIIVIGMSLWRENDEKWISQLIKFANKKNFEIIVKLHPRYKVTNQKLSEQKIKIISENCKSLNYIFTHDMDISFLLAASDLVITDYSSIGSDAIILGKPMIVVNFENESMEGQHKYHDYGAAVYVHNNYNMLEETILDIFEKGKYLKDLEEGRKKFIELHNFYNDGKSTERIIKYLIEK